MAQTPETNKNTDGAQATPETTASGALTKASLSEKAEKLAARLEEHKMAQPQPNQEGQAQPAAGQDPAPTAVQPTLADRSDAAPTASGTPDPAEDVIRAIKLPHEVAAEKQAKAAKADTQPATRSTAAIPAPPATETPAPQQTATSAAVVAEARNRVSNTFTPEPEPSEAAMKRRVARERALSSRPPLARTAQVLLAVIFPYLAVMAAIRVVASPLFLALAYARPGFPADQFGFGNAERLVLGSYGVDYLNNFAGPEYLAGLRGDQGQALFSSAEVQHMVDVKNLIGVGYVSAVILGLLAIVLLAYLARRYAGGVRRGLFAGALVTLGLIVLLVISAMLGWQTFFTGFHELFFSAGTWTFAASDTLIRLYPGQFWVDSAITVAALVLIAVTVVLISCWPTGRRREAARLRQEARVFGLGAK